MDFTNDEKFDNILLDVIQNVNTLPNFLDVLFGFLRRKTDLFYIMDDNHQEMGFKAGKAEKLIVDAFKKHKQLFEITNVASNNILNKLDSKPVNVDNTVAANVSKNVGKHLPTDNSNEVVYVADAESYNGAVRDNYTWSQTIGELDIRVKVPEIVSNSKQIKVTVDKKRLNISYRIDPEIRSPVPIVVGDLCWEVKKNDVFWSFDRKDNKIFVTMEKVQERWWDAFFVGEETINTRQIDCSRPMSDLDDEAQAKIHKLMFDNQQKQLGRPTSDQQKINDTLRSAWNSDGSPFKGTDFDPSTIDIVGNH